MGELFTPGHLIVLLLFLSPIILAIQFAPTIIAARRRMQNFWWIFAINFLFGWTLIGWVVALTWALRDEPGLAGNLLG